eukprot:2311581-Amphidinium_carterae.1
MALVHPHTHAEQTAQTKKSTTDWMQKDRFDDDNDNNDDHVTGAWMDVMPSLTLVLLNVRSP